MQISLYFIQLYIEVSYYLVVLDCEAVLHLKNFKAKGNVTIQPKIYRSNFYMLHNLAKIKTETFRWLSEE